MLTRIRGRINYASVAATLALVFAMTGGAYAAGKIKIIITSTKQISPAVLKSLHGATGKAGPAGPAGLQGATGPTGPAGATGEKGKEGERGKEGKEGEKGSPGSPWTAGGFLPSKKSESGVWAVAGTSKAGQSTPDHLDAAISFTVPLKEPLSNEGCPSAAPCQAHVIPPGTPAVSDPAGCAGTLSEHPEAEPGNLCVFTGASPLNVLEEPGFFGIIPLNPEVPSPGAGKSGALLDIVAEAEAFTKAEGVWVVTAP